VRSIVELIFSEKLMQEKLMDQPRDVAETDAKRSDADACFFMPSDALFRPRQMSIRCVRRARSLLAELARLHDEEAANEQRTEERARAIVELSSRFFSCWPYVSTCEVVDERPVYNWRGATSYSYETTVHVSAPRLPLPVIDSKSILDELAAALDSCSSAAAPLTAEGVLEECYATLRTSLTVVEPGTVLHAALVESVRSTHAATHATYRLELHHAFEIERKGEAERFHDLGNRRLLYHGSRLTNWVGLLTNGQRIAPCEAPVTGYMFGKGVYFGNMSSKSANYCFASREQPNALMLLSDVSLGRPYELQSSEYEAASKSKAKGCDSTWGKGKTTPRFRPLPGDAEGEGPLLPVGPCGPRPAVDFQGCEGRRPELLYDEYIVYNLNQIKQRFLLWLKVVFM